MNIVIPEFVERVDYAKGPYSAGTWRIWFGGHRLIWCFTKTLPEDFVTVEWAAWMVMNAVFSACRKPCDRPTSLWRRSVS